MSKFIVYLETISYFSKFDPKSRCITSVDFVYTIAANSFKMLDSIGNEITIFNKGIEIWKKQEDGSWKCVVDIFTPDPSVTLSRHYK